MRLNNIYSIIRNFIGATANKTSCSFFLFSFLVMAAPAQNLQLSDTTFITTDYDLNEVVVTGTRNETDIRHLPMTISVVKRETIEKSLEPSLLPVLTEQVPGLFITGRGVLGYGVSAGSAGGMSLRGVGGSPTTGLLVLIDGHPQYMGLMGHPISDAYQSMLAEQVEVVRGPASVLYGSNAMGGVINIVTRKQKQEGVKTGVNLGYGSYNTLTTEVFNQIKKGKFNSIITGSYNRTDGHRRNMEFEQYSGYAKVNYDINTAWNMFADMNLVYYNASNPGEVTTPLFENDSHITRGMTSFSLENIYQNTSGAFKFFYNWGKHKINDGYEESESPLDFRFYSRDRMAGFSLYQSAALFTGNRLTAGIDYMNFGGEAWNRYITDGHTEEITDKSENEIAGYIDFRQELGLHLTFDAGIRLDHHSVSGTEWIPQVGLSARLPKNSSLKAMVSKGFRNPTIRELYMFRPANPELLPERVWSYELSFSQRILDNSFYYGINLFYLKGDNMIQRVFVNNFPLNMNTEEIENWGLEANMAYRINPMWNISANYSWLHMENLLLASPEHKFYAGADFTLKRLNISTGLQYISGLYTDILPEDTTKENYLLWNLRSNYRLTDLATIYVKGENLLAQRYEINAGYPMPKATVMAGLHLRF